MSWYKRPMFKDAVNMQIGGMVPLPRMEQGSDPTDFSQRAGNRVTEIIDNTMISPYLAEVGFFEDPSFEKYVAGARLYNQSAKYGIDSAAPFVADSISALRDGYQEMMRSFKQRRGEDSQQIEQAMRSGAVGAGLPRMQTGTGPMGIASVSPELFSSAEFMGEPLNQMSEAGAGIPGAGFFPEGNFGAPAVTDAGIVAGLEEMSAEPEVKENKLELAKQQAMSIFDQKFDETMAVMQAQMVAGGMPMQDMEMILSDEIEVMEGQAEATVKEAMNLPEEVDLIPAEVAQSYLEKARMIVSGPKQEPSMDMPMDMGDQAVQKMVIGTGPTGVQPEEKDPLSIIEEMRQQSIEREEKRREIEAEAARDRRDANEKKIRAGDFRNEFMTDWQKLDDLKERVKDVAKRKASYESPISPALSTMGGKYLSAMKMIPERADLAGDEAVLKYETEIEKLKQAEQQALLQNDAAMLREVHKQGQKIEDQLSNTLMQNIGDIERQAITETGDILTKQIGDEGFTDTWRTDQYWLGVLEDPNSSTLQKRVAEQALGIGSGKGDIATRTAEFVKLANASWKDYKSPGGGTMDYNQKVAAFEKEFAPLIDFYGSTIVPTDPNFSNVVRQYMQAQAGGAPITQTTPSAPRKLDLGTMGVPMDQANAYIDGMIMQGFLGVGDTVRLPSGKETIITQEMIDDLGV